MATSIEYHFMTVCFVFLPEEKLISILFIREELCWTRRFYSWARVHEDYLIVNDRIFDLLAAAGTS